MTLKDDDFNNMLKDINLTVEQLNQITLHGNMVRLASEETKRKKSTIHGYGMFAKVNFKKNDIIGLASINNTHKTNLGRYTNHSKNANIVFKYLKNYDLVAVCLIDIEKDQELLVNYRTHILTPTFL